MKIEKTNVARILDSHGIDYKLLSYEVDFSDLSATHLAELSQVDICYVFKTLVLKGDKTGYLVCVIPGAEEVDLKKIAQVSNNKKCEMIAMKDLLSVTGYIRGACSPIGMKKKFPTYIDRAINTIDSVYVSAGKRGVQLLIKPSDLINIAQMSVESVIKQTVA